MSVTQAVRVAVNRRWRRFGIGADSFPPPSGECVAVQRARIGLAHQSRNAMLATRLPSFTENGGRARGHVNAMARDERRPNQAKQPGVFLGPSSGESVASSQS